MLRHRRFGGIIHRARFYFAAVCAAALLLALPPAAAQESQEAQAGVPIDSVGLARSNKFANGDWNRLLESGRISSVLPTDIDELLEYRQQKVDALEHLAIYPKDYQATTSDVFSRVVNTIRWSKEDAFYVANPQLLVITTPTGFVRAATYWATYGNDADEQTLTHYPQQKRTTIAYRDVSANHWFRIIYNYFIGVLHFDIEAVNARDAGYLFGMVDLKNARNIDEEESGAIVREPIEFAEVFYYKKKWDENGLYTGPWEREVVYLNEIAPTIIPIKLWKEKPQSPQQAADWTYVIEVVPNPDAAGYDQITEKPLWWVFVGWVFEEEFEDEESYRYEGVVIFSQFGLPILLLLLGFLVGRYAENRHYASIRRREARLLHIPVITMEESGAHAVRSAQLVHGEMVVATDYFKRFIAWFRKVFGGEVKSYSSVLDRARREAILRMKEQHPKCDAFVNLRVQHSVIKRGCVEVLVYATALYYDK